MGKIKRIAAARKAATKWRGSVEVGAYERLREPVGAKFTQPFGGKSFSFLNKTTLRYKIIQLHFRVQSVSITYPNLNFGS